MADTRDKSSRKSVSFADNHAIVDENGEVKKVIANAADGDSAESHSKDDDAAVDEVTDMFGMHLYRYFCSSY
jgi:hypothetical protein